MLPRWWVALLVVGGCYRPAAEQACAARCTAEDTRCPDGTACGADLSCHAIGEPDCSDAAPPSDASFACYGGKGLSEFGSFCPDPATIPLALDLPAALTLDSGPRLDTGFNTACTVFSQEGGGQVCILIARDITVSADLGAKGTRPLVLIATHDLTVNAGVRLRVDSGGDVSMGIGVFAGPGCNDASCEAAHSGMTTTAYGGGGAGGGFGGDGAPGGAGSGPGGLVLTALSAAPAHIRGGCGGGMGAAGFTSGGPSGGGLYLVAGNRISILGTILASGGGGYPTILGPDGGAGGGSGGMVAFEAPSVRIEGGVIAEGGGGSGGSSIQGAGKTGGDDGGTLAYAMGGAGAINGGGRGGDGSSAGHPSGMTGATATNNVAGGGGGGGTGFILVFSPQPMLFGPIHPPPLVTSTSF